MNTFLLLEIVTCITKNARHLNTLKIWYVQWDCIKNSPKKGKKQNKTKQNPTSLCCFYILYYINKKIKRSKIFLLTNCTLKTYLFMLCPTVELYALRYFVESFQICYAISLYSQLVCYLYPVYYLFRICQA